jgi:hypothetical protein
VSFGVVSFGVVSFGVASLVVMSASRTGNSPFQNRTMQL